MKLIIAGGRDRQLTQAEIKLLDELRVSPFFPPVEEVISGCADGVDKCGEQWARSHGIPVKEFDVNWADLSHPNAIIRYRRDGTAYDAGAGPRRNAAMASYANAVALFAGGKGTASMYREAKKAGLTIFDFRNGS